MKKYIGTKEIEAEPMTMGEAYERGFLQAGRVPNEAEKHNAGYHVKYKDGYESWSPAGPFENAYWCSETPLDRMLIEGRDLVEKMEKLRIFINSDKFKELDINTQAMLNIQLGSMHEYSNALNVRYARMDGNDTKCAYLTFGQAITLLRAGFLLRRSGWNGKNIYVFKQVPAEIDGNIIPKMTSLPQQAKDKLMNTTGYISYTSQCLIVNEDTGRADSWVPSISDVFAEDWEIVE